MGKDTELRDGQLLNVPSGRISKPSPITTLVSEEQLLNTFEPKDTCAGIIISFKAVQSLNAFSAICMSDEGSVMFLSFVHSVNALQPITSMPSAM